jgi:succinate dehydrogenase hydrophobic anchor subunit
MSKAPYEPPTQSVIGQIVDAFLMLVLVLVILYLPLLLGLAGGGTTTQVFDSPTWESLGQNAVMAAQWEKLGFDPAKAAEIIGKRFDYSFSWLSFAITAVVIVGYFVAMLRWSDKEYREVIAERFGDDVAPRPADRSPSA